MLPLVRVGAAVSADVVTLSRHIFAPTRMDIWLYSGYFTTYQNVI